MDIDLDEVFRDDDDDLEDEFNSQGEINKEYVVYLVDASPNMFNSISGGDQDNKSQFHVAVSCIAQALRTLIINRNYDEVAVCFFNTQKKQNLQDLNGVFVFNVAERDMLDRPTARLIKEFDSIEESFMKDIGSQQWIQSGSRENSLYNALWVAQGLLRKGSSRTSDKRILLFTSEDDPFGIIHGTAKFDMTRTTLQRAKDAQDLGISIELLPLPQPETTFNVSIFYADLIGLDKDEIVQFVPSASQKLEDMKNELRKRMFSKRIVRRITLIIPNGVSIELNSYALYRPTVPGAITWLDAITNRSLKAERSFICADTGALMQGNTLLHCQPYKNEVIKFSAEELAQIKNIPVHHLRLLGFKPFRCLKDYHNMRPSTFLFPSDKEIIGSTSIFIALLRSMLRFRRFAVAFKGDSNPRFVALYPQDEIISEGGQIEPPGMHMIYLPYSDDMRQVEELHLDPNQLAPRANDEQMEKASSLIRRISLKEFSVCQFANPALQRHYAVLQALALEEDDIPEAKDETLPDKDSLSKPGVTKVIEEFKLSVYGNNYDDDNSIGRDKNASDASRKRKALAEDAEIKSKNYNWEELAENGKLKDLTVVELKYYLTANNLHLTGKKDALINRILSHMGK